MLHKLEKPFFVLATENPIEMEGTFPLPEAQLDRFMLKMSTGYVKTLELESEILRRRIQWKADDPVDQIGQRSPATSSFGCRNWWRTASTWTARVLDYISRIVRATREHPAVEVGSSPRGGLALLKASRSMAAMAGRDFVTPDDVKLFASDALQHRIILKMEFEIEGNVTPGSVVAEVVAQIEPPKDFMKK